MEINIENYLSEAEIKEIVADQLRSEVSALFRDEKNASRILSNLSYQIVFDEVDKIIPNSLGIISEKTAEVVANNNFSYSVFRDASYGSPASLGYTYIEQAVKENKELINQKVKEAIENRDYSDDVWNKFEELADTFTSNIYSIVELGRKGKSNE